MGACQAQDSGESGSGVPDYVLQCSTDCPAQTRLSKATAREVQEQGGILITKEGCVSKCIPEQPCLPPFVPRVTSQGGTSIFECTATDGLSGIPADSEVKFDFAAGGTTPDITLRRRVKLPLADKGLLAWFRVGDFDGDGRQELLAVAAYGTSDQPVIELRTYTLAGTTLTQSSTTPLTDLPYMGPVGDLDGDGKADLVMGTHPPKNAADPVSLLVARSTGAGFSFGEPIEPSCYQGLNGGIQGDVGDFDGDGKLDVLLLPVPCDGSDVGTATIRLGALGAATPFETALAVLVGDLDGDGKADLVMNRGADHFVSFLNQGGLSFLQLQPFENGLPGGVTLGDFSGDGVLDLLTHDRLSAQNSFVSQVGDGKGNFQPGADLSLPGEGCLTPAFGDLDGDGRLDVVCVSEGMLNAAMGSGQGVYSRPYGDNGIVAEMAVADLDGDGRAEIAVFSNNTLEIWEVR